ncbi:hypothetical protein PGB90_010681 [Kerria lacca]
MDNENRNVVNEEEVYSMTSAGNITYNEIVTPNRTVLSSNNTVFKAEWQNFPEFQSWLRPIPDDKSKAWCQACEKVFKADLKSLRVHGVGRSHIRMVQTKFPEAAASSPPPAAVYNVITDRKGTYGLGILSKTDSNPTAGSTLYVNPTNPNTNVLTCDPKQDKDNFVIVSMPKSELENLDQQQNQIQDLQQLQFDSQVQKKGQTETNETSKIRGMKRFANSNKNQKTCNSFPDNLIETEVKCSMNRKRVPLKRNNLSYQSYSSQSYNIATVTKQAPFWKAKAIVNGHISELKLNDYLGRYLILFFYPQDFSRLCAKEIIELSDRISEFRNINTEVVACSVDSYLTHQVWSKMSKNEGGVSYPKIPLLSDYTHEISKNYGCYLAQTGHTLRAHYIIDTKGILRHITINDIQVTRDISEILRLIQSFQRTDELERNAEETT